MAGLEDEMADNEQDFGFPDGWEDSALVSSFRQNGDGTVTANIQVNIRSDDGREWVAHRKIRLRRERAKT